MDKKASRLSRMRKDVGVQKETRSTPITALVLRLCKAIPKPSTLCPTVVEMFSWSRDSGVMHEVAQVVLTPMDLPAQAVCLSMLIWPK